MSSNMVISDFLVQSTDGSALLRTGLYEEGQHKSTPETQTGVPMLKTVPNMAGLKV